MTRTELESTLQRVHRLRVQLAELDRELRSRPEYGPRTSEVRRRYCELLIRSACLKQSAIERAIAIYRIDVNRHLVHGSATRPATSSVR